MRGIMQNSSPAIKEKALHRVYSGYLFSHSHRAAVKLARIIFVHPNSFVFSLLRFAND